MKSINLKHLFCVASLIVRTVAVAAETEEHIWAASPNFYARRPNVLVLHYTEVPLAQVLEIFCQGNRAASHYTVSVSGKVYQHVAETQAAKHAGTGSLSYWHGEDVNSRSLGVEVENLGPISEPMLPGAERRALKWHPFLPAQISRVIALCKELINRWGIPPENILAHSDVAPWRDAIPDVQGKIDPGPLFPWVELARQGIGIAYDPVSKKLVHGDTEWDLPPASYTPGEILHLQDRLSYWGYLVPQTGVLDARTCNVIRAFRMHYLGEWATHVDELMIRVLEGLIHWRDTRYRGVRTDCQ
jgi:N-acetylmuramoyl-L-alanine amidase